MFTDINECTTLTDAEGNQGKCKNDAQCIDSSEDSDLDIGYKCDCEALSEGWTGFYCDDGK